MMKILDRHIASGLLRIFFVILLILAVLFSFFELMAQMDAVGTGAYRVSDALFFVLLTLPKRLLDLMSICTLLAGIIALGLMADHGELLAMQAAGISRFRISLSTFAAGILLMLAAGILAEWVVPPMEQKAHQLRAQLLYDKDVTLIGQGIWTRRKDTYIHASRIIGRGLAADLDIFEFTPEGRLKTFSHAKRAVIRKNGQWMLSDITRKVIKDREITTTEYSRLELDKFLTARQVRVLQLPPYSLPTRDLIRYIRALRQGGQDPDPYLLALWRKFTVPLTTGAMLLLSLSFVFGSARNISAGRRIMLGSLVGVAFYFADQLIMNLGLLLSLNPLATALIPALLISGAASWQLTRYG